MIVISKTVAVIIGTLIVILTLRSAVRTFIVPRLVGDGLTRFVFVVSRAIFNFRMRWAKTYVERDRVFAVYAPVTLVALPPVWLTLVTTGYALILWGISQRSFADSFLLSGSSILTLGFATADNLIERLVVFSEATLGLILVAILISYLPTMYSNFSAREKEVTRLEVWASSPPSAIEMLLRLHRIDYLNNLDSFWERWEEWFAELEESHTSLPMLVFYRSPVPEYSWVTASGTVMDAAALFASTIDTPYSPRPPLCIRAGYLALRRIVHSFGIVYPELPTMKDEISITREEFDSACRELKAAGLPLKADLDQAWLDFKGWRVNYDIPLRALCTITMAPYASWSSDRPLKLRSNTYFYRKNRAS